MIATGPDRDTLHSRFQRSHDLPAVCSEAACRELVRRIVHAPTFARSERMGSLLTYVCDMALQGREEEINEQRIGHAVFGRPQAYDSATDGIVRSQASRLRQRLELYFRQEGVDEPVRIVIPRGGYVPVFEAQETSVFVSTSNQPTEAVAGIAPPKSGQILDANSRLYLRPWLLLSSTLVLMSILAAVWIHDRRSPVPVADAHASQTHLLWSHLFRKDQPTMIVAPDSGLVLFHGMSGQSVNLETYLDAGYRSEPNGPLQTGPSSTRKDWLIDLANRRYTSMVDLQTILSLKDRAQKLGSEVSVRYARDLRPNDFKSGNVILLGSSMANPWEEIFEHKMNFLLEDDHSKVFVIVNCSPKEGEPERWEIKRNDPQRRVFGLIAYMPNLAGEGNALVLEGTSMSGTEAAADFVMEDSRLQPFLNQIRRSDGTLPHFELLLITQNMGASATKSQILSWRTVD